MATIRAFTTVEQSRKLAEILPQESADMFYCYGMDIETKEWHCDETPTIEDEFYKRDIGDVPCWSLAALFGVLPSATLDSSDDHHYRLHCNEKFTEWHDNPIDCCVAMINRLHEQMIYDFNNNN